MFIFSILNLVLSKNSCPLYSCSPDHLFLLPTTCVFFDNTRYTPGYYIQACSNPSFPVCNFTLSQNSSCIAQNTTTSNLLTLRHPGSKCKQGSDCLSRSCLGQVCSGKSEGSKCVSNSDCNPGLFCSSNLCSALKDEGSSCFSDFECEPSCGCFKRKCVKYRSLPTGDSVDTCDSFGESLFCLTGKCEKNKCSPVKTNQQLPQLCLKDADCPSACECGKNRNADRFCRLEAGDPGYSEYLGFMAEFLSSGRNVFCNTEKRTSFECAADWWDLRKAQIMKEMAYFVHNYAVIVEYDDCVHDLFIPEYLVEDLLSFSSAFWISFALSSVM